MHATDPLKTCYSRSVILALGYDPMRRREFITLLSGTAATWPLAARAQQPAMPAIGFLSSGSPGPMEKFVAPFREGVSQFGYVEGKNVAIEYCWAEEQHDRLPALAADLVRRQVSVIALAGLPAALAAKAATRAIPIVFLMAADPVQLGLVASLSRPGGNMTGVVSLTLEAAPKLLELLHELVPRATAIALLVNPANSAQAESTTKEAQVAAHKLGLELHVLHASAEDEFEPVFASSVQLRAAAVVIGPDPLFNSRSEQLGALAVRHAIPAICPYREFAMTGGLASYGTNFSSLFRQLGVYTGRILKGDKPADLPVQQAVKLDLIINLKIAKTLGFEIPPTLLARADEVIE
jgi:putative ABC transport system substrate-binding protein